MSTVKRVVFVSTGELNEILERAAAGFESAFGPLPFETLHLGSVSSLYAAYRNAARLIDDSSALFLFCHHDARPWLVEADVNLDQLESRAVPDQLTQAIADPKLWARSVLALAEDPSTGFMGVAGARSLEAGMAWWNMPDVSGLMIHQQPDASLKVNLYGEWGRVLVLDGVLLMATGAAFEVLGDPKPSPARFHFYDMELSLEAHAAELKNWTVPLPMIHTSGGTSVTDAQWQEDLSSFLERFGASLPVSVPREPLPGDL